MDAMPPSRQPPLEAAPPQQGRAGIRQASGGSSFGSRRRGCHSRLESVQFLLSLARVLALALAAIWASRFCRRALERSTFQTPIVTQDRLLQAHFCLQVLNFAGHLNRHGSPTIHSNHGRVLLRTLLDAICVLPSTVAESLSRTLWNGPGEPAVQQQTGAHQDGPTVVLHRLGTNTS